MKGARMNAATKETLYQEFCSLYPELAGKVTDWRVMFWEDHGRRLRIELDNGLRILFEVHNYLTGEWNEYTALLIPKPEA